MEVLAKESRYLPALAVLLLITIGATAWLLREAGNQPTKRPVAVEALLLAQAASLQSGLALAGSQAAFEDLNELSGRIEALNTASLTKQQNAQLQKVKTSAQAVLNGREDILSMRLAVNRLQERVPSFAAATREFQELYSRTRKELPVAQSERLRLLADALLAQMQGLLLGSNSVDVEQIVANEMELQQLIQALQSGDSEMGIDAVEGRQAQQALDNIARRASQIGGAVRDGLALSGRVQTIFQAGRNLEAAARAMGVTQSQLDVPTGNPELSAEFDRLFALLAGAALLVLIMLALWVTSVWKQRKVQADNAYGEGDQAAILRLLDELGSLADGDLTVQATVTEDITGAIADSINYTIEALRDLVGTINSGAILLEDATKQTEASARALAIASKNQSQQVKNAATVVKQMAASIDEVSADAERSSDVARHSVDVAHKGGEAVRRTIEGMNTIRETIQETSKRIKRLGESSQEIGDIVELINDIADQTNVLALNASIQASMAGEAGRGFAVVADEVQRLAERSANATRQIEVLVSTIQADTNEAVVSMERSTTDVVGGALLAENAGAALEEIEQVSNQIAMLVQNISGSAREQTESAKTVLDNVEKLTDISRKAEKSAAITTKFINKIAALATKLRHSVAGFVLPGEKMPAPQPAAAPEQAAPAAVPSAEPPQQEGDDILLSAAARQLATDQSEA